MFQIGFFNVSSWCSYFWWFYKEIDCLTIERIWIIIETMLFYYSVNSTSPQIWLKIIAELVSAFFCHTPDKISSDYFLDFIKIRA